jgi:hypothetical protein
MIQNGMHMGGWVLCEGLCYGLVEMRGNMTGKVVIRCISKSIQALVIIFFKHGLNVE